MPEIRMGGAKISYGAMGKGEAVLLVHGWIGSGALWGMVAPWLSERFHVIAPDLPGHGDSGIPDGFRFTLEGFTAFLADLLRELGLERVSLVGHSMGGSICVHFAATHPDMVERLVLIDTPGKGSALGWPARVPLVHHLAGLLHIFWGPRITARLIKSSVLYPDDLPPTFLEEAVEQGSKVKKQALVETTHMLAQLDLDPLLPGIMAPTLIIYGDRDPSVRPAEAGRLRGLIPDAQLQMVPGCGHCPNYEYPDLVVGFIEAFMLGGIS
ncbi:MAG: alpha/beta hydrolase [Actinomycetota bacterium]